MSAFGGILRCEYRFADSESAGHVTWRLSFCRLHLQFVRFQIKILWNTGLMWHFKERPSRTLNIPDFWLRKTLVTWPKRQTFMKQAHIPEFALKNGLNIEKWQSCGVIMSAFWWDIAMRISQLCRSKSTSPEGHLAAGFISSLCGSKLTGLGNNGLIHDDSTKDRTGTLNITGYSILKNTARSRDPKGGKAPWNKCISPNSNSRTVAISKIDNPWSLIQVRFNGI